ncbi:MAG: hypothetical protein QM484_12570 [Woeseiaceae bacterium]
MKFTTKSTLTISLLVLLSSTGVIANEMENHTMPSKAEMSAREGAENFQAQTRDKAMEAETNRASQANQHEKMGHTQANDRMQQAREHGQQMEHHARNMTMERPTRVERPTTASRPSFR